MLMQSLSIFLGIKRQEKGRKQSSQNFDLYFNNGVNSYEQSAAKTAGQILSQFNNSRRTKFRIVKIQKAADGKVLFERRLNSYEVIQQLLTPHSLFLLTEVARPKVEEGFQEQASTPREVVSPSEDKCGVIERFNKELGKFQKCKVFLYRDKLVYFQPGPQKYTKYTILDYYRAKIGEPNEKQFNVTNEMVKEVFRAEDEAEQWYAAINQRICERRDEEHSLGLDRQFRKQQQRALGLLQRFAAIIKQGKQFVHSDMGLTAFQYYFSKRNMTTEKKLFELIHLETLFDKATEPDKRLQIDNQALKKARLLSSDIRRWLDLEPKLESPFFRGCGKEVMERLYKRVMRYYQKIIEEEFQQLWERDLLVALRRRSKVEIVPLEQSE